MAQTPAPKTAGLSVLQELLLLLAADYLNNDRTHAREIARLVADVLGEIEAPVNRDVPYASQPTTEIVDCTMGNWDGEPTEYSYEWHIDGIATGPSSPSSVRVLSPANVGHGLACVVTATNALGSTKAPMSNTVVVTV
jgi:hypothetical protein